MPRKAVSCVIMRPYKYCLCYVLPLAKALDDLTCLFLEFWGFYFRLLQLLKKSGIRIKRDIVYSVGWKTSWTGVLLASLVCFNRKKKWFAPLVMTYTKTRVCAFDVTNSWATGAMNNILCGITDQRLRCNSPFRRRTCLHSHLAFISPISSGTAFQKTGSWK